ncbi:hypothetical protein KCU64_g56, partial [Aureobasidium melanogenum]
MNADVVIFMSPSYCLFSALPLGIRPYDSVVGGKSRCSHCVGGSEVRTGRMRSSWSKSLRLLALTLNDRTRNAQQQTTSHFAICLKLLTVLVPVLYPGALLLLSDQSSSSHATAGRQEAKTYSPSRSACLDTPESFSTTDILLSAPFEPYQVRS